MASCFAVTALLDGNALALTVGAFTHDISETKKAVACVNTIDGYLCFLLGHREIQALGVRCNSVEIGCGREGTAGTLKDHVTKCGFTMVACPNGCASE